MARTVEKGRSAETGQFVPIDYAKSIQRQQLLRKSKLALQSGESDFYLLGCA